MTNIESLQRDIKLLQLCIDNSPGQIMPNCDTPEIRKLFNEITEGVPEDWKEVRWWALEETSVPAKQLQIQLMKDEIAKEERILKRIETGGTFFELAEEPAAWNEYEQLNVTSYYAKKADASPVENEKPKRRRRSRGPEFDNIIIDEEVPREKKTTPKTPEDFAPSFDDIGW